MANNGPLVTELSVIAPEGVRRWRQVGDTYDRLALLADGTFLVGSGSAAPTAPAGSVDAVYTQAAVVAAPAALTAVPAVAGPTKAEYDALLADVTALRTTQAAILVALKGTGKPMASA